MIANGTIIDNWAVEFNSIPVIDIYLRHVFLKSAEAGFLKSAEAGRFVRKYLLP